MNLLETILSSSGGGIAQQIGAQFGLDQNQVSSAIKVLGPIVAGALAQNMGRSGGLDSLLGALKGDSHSQYIDNPSILNQPSTTKDGNGILEHLLGDKEVSREAANRAAGQSGVGADILKKLLPVLSAVVMGGLSKGARQEGVFDLPTTPTQPGAVPPAQGGLIDMLKPMLDQNNDGSAVDDILRMATKYLK